MSSQATAVVFEQPGKMSVRKVGLVEPGEGDCVIDIEWSGISTGTERLLWHGRMPAFPGLAYPLVPGYESVGRVAAVGDSGALTVGERVFVPGSRGYTDVQGLFGGAADRLVVDARRVTPLSDALGEEAALLALAATALRAVTRGPEGVLPDLVIGHGVLGRLVARVVLALGGEAPTVWERDASRRAGANGYPVIDPGSETRRDYRLICDVSGAAGLLDTLVGHLAPGGCIVLAGFYEEPVSFTFPPAFMREAQLRISAEWQQEDLEAVVRLVADGRLDLDGLITHRQPAAQAAPAYRQAFGDSECLKMILDWRSAK
ncbi:chlorophyll synthesis pathway protein BchC [Pseudohaliea rubra]|uniref:2-desacetyl-2-hydroxyethyl bacteriochlorophyllide A dehydrogenase BchC n=1 Tax=Pseudohaliea rubra DSM 19751 TaxID=1265313 RepID=A0A095VV30_9GAMM|nr:chlorophyll synthesis pathway protein BchC [Pseudohaliea rubra]KGE05200.1 2-desacetyl-2-hydroxyethyl bacteriochlorophyllide A dehydrogenase BchC [Pseudohaliea rubra DSM 19751]